MNTIYTVDRVNNIYRNQKGKKSPLEGTLVKTHLDLLVGSKVSFSVDGYSRMHNNQKMLYVVFHRGGIRDHETLEPVELNDDDNPIWIREDSLCTKSAQI